jgi:hypothetical protein
LLQIFLAAKGGSHEVGNDEGRLESARKKALITHARLSGYILPSVISDAVVGAILEITADDARVLEAALSISRQYIEAIHEDFTRNSKSHNRFI